VKIIGPQKAVERETAWLFIALCLIAVAPVGAQIGEQGRVGDFKHRELYPSLGGRVNVTNRVKNYITGVEGRYLTKNLIALTSTRLENYAPEGQFTNLVATVPACLLDTSSRIISSTGRLELLGLQRRLLVRGDEGFLFQLTNSTLFVSNHVRTYIHPELLHSVSP